MKLTENDLKYISDNPISILIDWEKISSEFILEDDFIDKYSNKLHFLQVTSNNYAGISLYECLLYNYDFIIERYENNKESQLEKYRLNSQKFFMEYYPFLLRDFEKQSQQIKNNYSLLDIFLEVIFEANEMVVEAKLRTGNIFKKVKVTGGKPILVSGYDKSNEIKDQLSDEFKLFIEMNNLDSKWKDLII